ncbi:MAG: tetratricopeptide repeat protein [Sphingobacteriaceae bacterium]
MKAHLFKSLVFLLLLSTFSASAALFRLPADTTQKQGIKSYFLLRLNLETDPVDIQNYANTLEFREQFQAFAGYYQPEIATMDKERSSLLRWAITDALNGNFDHSLSTFNRYLSQEPVQENKTIQPGIYQLMSLILEMKENYEQALLHQQKALNLAIAVKNSPAIAQSYIRLGKIKSLQGEFADADRYLIRLALPAITRLKDKQGIAVCYREIADRYVRQDLFSQANWFYLQSLTQSRKNNYYNGIIAALLELGELKYEIGDYEPALKNWHEAEIIAIEQHNLPVLLQLKLKMAMAFKQSDKPLLLERYILEFEQLRDILLNPGL